MKKTPSDHIEAMRAGLDDSTRETLDALRAVVRAASAELTEDFKWNAPSFRLAADHRVTLGIERRGGVRMVLHRGVERLPPTDFRFDDVDRQAKWPAADRGVIVVANVAEVESRRDALVNLVGRWVLATSPS